MSNSLQNIRIARVSTIPFFVLTQLRTQLEVLVDSGASVSVITSKDELSNNLQMIEGCKFQPVFLAREISLVADFLSLITLWKMFRREKFDIVHSTTPKAGMLCAIAAKLAGVSICIHTYTGQPWVTMEGIKRTIVKFSDKLISWLNTCCYTDSFSQRDFLIENKIAYPDKLKVIGKGSLAGVNIERFCQENFSDDDRQQLRENLGIADSTTILLFVGRITKEKGIFETIDAVHTLVQDGHDIALVAVGPFEQNNEGEIRAYANERCNDKVIFAGFQAEPERFMAMSDLLCLPSYREGFGTVVIEAAAMSLPVVGTKIYGLSDAVVDGITGILIEPRNSSELMRALKTLLLNDELRIQMGKEARNRAINDFDSKKCNELLVQEYKQLLNNSKSKRVNK